MIDAAAERLAIYIKKANEQDTATVEVMKFSLIVILNALAIIVLTLMIGVFTGKFWATLLSLFAFAALRMVAGGYHLRSSDWCVVVSTLLFSIIPHIPLSLEAAFLLNLISLVAVLWKAPSRIENQTRIPSRYYPLLKLVSGLLVAANFLFLSPGVTLSFLVLSISLFMKGGE